MHSFNSPRSRLELTILVILAFTTTLVFWFSDLDIVASSSFYHPENPKDAWPERHWWLWQALFDYASPFIGSFLAGAILLFLIGYVYQPSLKFRRAAIYIILVIAIGPGLLVNLIAKDHWGRPRPMHITEFGGEYQYIPPLKLGNTPDKSFVCGHCSVSYSFFSLYFLAKHYRIAYLLLTLGFAAVMGYTRMLAGGHFLSDVLWSGYLVFLVAYLLYYGWYVRGISVEENQNS